MKKYIFFFILLIPFSLFGQKYIKISGTVADGMGKPLDLATVAIEGSVIGTLTDGKGYYSLHTPVKDSVVVVFSCLGYKSTRRVIMAPESDFTLSVHLRSTEWEIDEVTVVASRKQTTTMQTIENDKSLIMLDAGGGNIESLVMTQMGVATNNELSSQYSVRGGNFDENLVYVNGIEVYRPFLVRSGQQEGLSFVNSDLVKDIKFSAGGFDAQYGDKMSSVLDIEYKKPERAFEASLSGSLMGGTAYVGQKSGRFSQIHGFRYKTASSLLSTLDTKGEYNPNFIDYQMFMTYEFLPKWEVSLLGNFSRNQYNFIPQSRTTSFGTLYNAKQFKVYFDGRERDQFLTGFGAFSLTNTSIKDTKLYFTVSSFTTREEETYDIAGEYWLNELEMDENSNVSTSGEDLAVGAYHEHARNRLNATVTNVSHRGTTRIKGNEIAWGFNFQWEDINDRIREWERRDSAGYNLPYTGVDMNMVYNLHSKNEMKSTRFAAYVQDTHKFRINEGLFAITGGIRAGYWDFNEEWIISPRFNFSFIPNWKHDFTFRLATGIYYQSPFYKELRETVLDANGNSVIELNKDIKSQRSIQIVGGMDYSFRAIDRPFKFTTEVYYKKLDDLIPYYTDNVRIRYAGKNISSGYAVGLDMKFFGKFVPGTDSWLTLSIMKSEETVNGKKLPRPTDQSYNLSLFFQDYFPGFPKWRLQLKGHLAGGLPFSPPNKGYEERNFRMSSYRRLDMGVTCQLIDEKETSPSSPLRFIRNMWFGVDVFNLLDISNVNSYYWITDVYNQQYAVPNYLTGRQLNVRLIIDF
ncbi:MAG: TonB-dependent receptor [Candidatus Azobacteroides sp.]|nr:TonB-dependent receptor [Candidatus Azobacteroides sp.]